MFPHAMLLLLHISIVIFFILINILNSIQSGNNLKWLKAKTGTIGTAASGRRTIGTVSG